MLFAELLSNGRNLCSHIDESLTWMTPTKISASFTLPMHSTLALRRRDGELGTMPVGWGLVPALAQLPHLTLGLWEVLLGFPLWGFKGQAFQVLAPMSQNAPSPVNYSMRSGFYHSPLWSGFDWFRQHHCFGCCFAVGISGHWHKCSNCSFSGPDWTLVVWFSLVHSEHL